LIQLGLNRSIKCCGLSSKDYKGSFGLILTYQYYQLTLLLQMIIIM